MCFCHFDQAKASHFRSGETHDRPTAKKYTTSYPQPYHPEAQNLLRSFLTGACSLVCVSEGLLNFDTCCTDQREQPMPIKQRRIMIEIHRGTKQHQIQSAIPKARLQTCCLLCRPADDLALLSGASCVFSLLAKLARVGHTRSAETSGMPIINIHPPYATRHCPDGAHGAHDLLRI